MRFLLDTNVLSGPVKSAPHPGLMRQLSAHEGELATCAIVWHELVYGAARLPRSRAAAGWHACERARLAGRGTPPSAADGQIAAIAAVNELVLVTSRIGRSLQHDRGHRGDENGLSDPLGPVASDVAGYFPTACGVADERGVVQIKRLDHGC